MNSEDILSDDDISDIIEENLDKYKIDNTIPNYVIDEAGPDNILKTEISICSRCMNPDIIGTVPFNRREIKPQMIRLDHVVHCAFNYFCKINNLTHNAGLAVLLAIANKPESQKQIQGSFTGISKRKGRNTKSKEFMNNILSNEFK